MTKWRSSCGSSRRQERRKRPRLLPLRVCIVLIHIVYGDQIDVACCLQGDPKVNDDPEFAPTLADVLALFHRRAGNEYTRDMAGKVRFSF